MRKLRRLSGSDVVRILSTFGFVRVSQKGSHIKLKRVLPNRTSQILIVPAHDQLDTGTLHAIYRQALRFIPEVDLISRFYHE